jgi:peptidoglycan/xylan/chitin deacetylase (PgdA/CDA1 family)
MPPTDVPTVYLTFDDGPDPTTTPDLLDVLGREGVHATFFLIDRHITDETAPIVRRMFAEGHSVALHSASRKYLLASPDELARADGMDGSDYRIDRVPAVPHVPSARGLAWRSNVCRVGRSTTH